MATVPFVGPVREITQEGSSINYAIVSTDGATKTLANNLINPGDMLKFDTANNCVIPVAAAGDFNVFVGIAEGQNPVSSNIDNGSAQNGSALNLMPVKPSGVAMLKTTVGDAAYAHGQAVKVGADAQTISTASVSTNIIGYIFNPQGLPLPTADGVSRVPVVFKCTYPFAIQ